MKKCTLCGETKPLEDFHKEGLMKGGYRNQCKNCRRDTTKERWRSEDSNSRNNYYKKHYGMTVQEFHTLYDEQGGRCAVCRVEMPLDAKYLPAVDHNHETGQVRGLLCMKCNRGIGYLQDDPLLLSRAADYVTIGNSTVA